MATSLFDKYGGFATVSTLVKDFYDRLMESDSLAGYFEGIDLNRLIDHQTRFLSHAIGGPDHGLERGLRAAHAPFNISSEDFDEVVRVLGEVLEDGGVTPEDHSAILSVVESTRADVTNS